MTMTTMEGTWEIADTNTDTSRIPSTVSSSLRACTQCWPEEMFLPKLLGRCCPKTQPPPSSLSPHSTSSLSPWQPPIWSLMYMSRDMDRSAAAAAKSLQSCPTLCNPRDGSPLGSSAPGILQARILEWVAISFSNAWKWKVKVKSLSCVWLLATPWTTGYQAPPSMGFSRQEYWSGVPLPSP